MNNNRSVKLSVAFLVVMVAYFASCSSAQITFSRDWLAGSGKRAAGQLTFSRDWLAGSGKREESVATADGDEAVAVSPAQAVDMLLDYLYLQAPV